MTIGFGKFAGTSIENLPTGYLQWCCENLDTAQASNKDLVEEMEKQLALRRGEGVSRGKGE